MAAGSICSFETRSTAEMKSANSRGEDETVSLPENIKALLMDGDAKSSSDSRLSVATAEKVHNEVSLSSLDETVRRDILNSVSVAVKEWDEAEKNLTDNMASRDVSSHQRSMSSPGKAGPREKHDLHSLHKSKYSKGNSNVGDNSPNSSNFQMEDSRSVRQRPVVSADESDYVSRPQPQDEGECYPQKMHRNIEPEEELSAVLRKYQQPRKTSKRDSNAWAKQQAQSTSNLFLRMSRQVGYGRRGSLPNPHRRNRIKLHVYDLIPAETVMQLPWGCMIPIGKCFDVVNSSLHSLGTGAYHVGIEVNGVEYSFGACDIPGHTGVFSCVPKRSPGYQYRTTIDFGERSLLKTTWVSSAMCEGDEDSMTPAYHSVERYVDGREVIKQMATEYMGIHYDLLRRNCVTFAFDACVRLGVNEEEIPSWFRNLCESGALTQDVALQTVEPIQSIFSACEDYGDFAEKTIEDGFEVITRVDGRGLQKVVTVMDAVESNQFHVCTDCPSMRRTLSWTY